MKRLSKQIAVTAIALAWLLSAAGLQATNFYFSVASGYWDVPGNWDLSRVPTTNGGDIAWIQNGRLATITNQASAATVYLGFTGNGNLEINGGTLAITFGQVGYTAGGFVTQSVGTVTVGDTLNVGMFGTGRYVLVNGSLSVGSLRMGSASGATGVFEQSGGSIGSLGATIGHASGGTGTYLMSGGDNAWSNAWYVGNSGRGTMVQSGGTNRFVTTVADRASVGRNAGAYGEYQMSGGVFDATNVPYFELGYAAGSTGKWVHSGTAAAAFKRLYVGKNGNGEFTQYGGTVSSTWEYVGVTNVGLYTQTGGVHEIGTSLELSRGGGTGTYTLAAGYLYVADQLAVGGLVGGVPSRGIFNHTGGTNVTGSLRIGFYDNLVADYTISGGQLGPGQVVVGQDGSGRGTLTVVGDGASIGLTGFDIMTNGTLRVDVVGGRLSPINVTGSAALSGALTVAYHGAPTYSTVVTALTATVAINGQFTVMNLPPRLESVRINYNTGATPKTVTLDQWIFPAGTIFYGW